MKDYKAIFDGIESTLFEVGSRTVPREQIQAELESCKHLEGKRFTDDEYFTLLVRIIFYAGFKAQIVTDKLAVIGRHFPNYNIVADYGGQEIQAILNDSEMIRNRRKIQACITNAKTFRSIISKHGSFQNFIDSFAATTSEANLIRLREDLQWRLAYLGDITVYHFLTDIGMPVLKPDRVIVRVFTRLGLVENNANPIAFIEEGKKFAQATGLPIRYIDIVFVAYGQVQTKELGLERGICLESNPSCSVCGVSKYCDYYARHHQKTTT
jgi:DNA-3-methyladenine glycosylase I